MSAYDPADSLHRLVKQALDSGAATSLEEAETIFRGYRVGLLIGENEAAERHHQAALLTAVALARRVFLGGVSVAGPLDVPLRCPFPGGSNLADAVVALGGTCTSPSKGTPLISVGGEPTAKGEGFHVRMVFAGWKGGIVPGHSPLTPQGSNTMHLAPMLAAGLAVNEAFSYVSNGSNVAGRRPIGFSLWNPASSQDWLSTDDVAPDLTILPSNLWLIGLGHLGQAYLWALGLLPYSDPSEVGLVLQDVDVITASTESTSVLSDANMLGQKKTRAMATWAETRGFSTRIVERLFDDTFARQEDDPAIALCGLDNAAGRRALDSAGFKFVVEAGLGRGFRDFQTIRLHTLPATRSAVDIWRPHASNELTNDQPAYQKLLSDGRLDQCGITLLAGKAVGAPFVGCVAACLAISEVLRLLHGGLIHELIDLDLKAVEHRITSVQPLDFKTINPGFVRC